jgi:lipoprotein-anchoring transpeptidase ErfK/SrfK
MKRLCAILSLLVAIFLITSTSLDAKTKRKSQRRHTATHKAKKEGTRARLQEPQFDPIAVNNPALQDVITAKMAGSAVLRAQVLLDRANFSVGEISGSTDDNFYRAVSGFRASRGLPAGPGVDAATWAALNVDTAPALIPYKIAPEDVQGPFVKIPEDMLEKAKLPSMGYQSPQEALGEKFHLSPKLLMKLNPGAKLQAGDDLLVPNVITTIPAKAGSVVVSKSKLTVEAYDPEGKLIAQYPATIGSEHDPLPIGKWKINGVSRLPKFHYNPELFWDAKPGDGKATLPPGPNSPVGVVWIDLSKAHYGIHGTPEPSTIGKTQSHGCIRLTNWDAMELADLVSPGLAAVLQE